MYLPAYLKKTLSTPESLAHEVQRRKLKTALSNAAQAVKLHTYPASPVNPLSVAEIKSYARNAVFVLNRNLPKYRPNSPERNHYVASVAYRAEVARYKVEHKELKQAEADARAAYQAFVTPSDLE
jgi:hypothetical protein